MPRRSPRPSDRGALVPAAPGGVGGGAGLRLPRASLVALSATLLGVGALGLSFGPLVRGRVSREADKRHLEVTVGAVRPGLFSVVLRDVDVKARGVEGVRVRLDAVRADLSATLQLRELAVRGGGIDVEGELSDVLERVRALRLRGGATPESDSPAGRRIPVSLEGVGLAWRVPSGGEISATGLRFARTSDGMSLRAERLAATGRRVTLEVTGADAELAPDGAPRRLSATTTSILLAPNDDVVTTAAPVTASQNEPAPPPLPAPSTKPKGKTKRGLLAAAPAPLPGAAVAPGADEPVLPQPDLHALRSRIALIAALLADRTPDGTHLEVGGLAAKLDVGGEPVAIGPGPFWLERRGSGIHVTFTSDDKARAAGAVAAPGGTPLSVDLDLPLGAGDVVARLAGGPVSLAVLGVKEGTKGLFDVAHGTISGKGKLALSAEGDALTFDGQVTLRGVSARQPRLAPEPIRGLAFGLGARGVLEDGGRLRIDEAQLDMGALHLRTHGTVEETREHFAVSLGVDVAPAACQALLESAPRGLLPTVADMRMSGTFGATARLVFDTRTIDKLELDYRVDDACRFTEVPKDLARERFAEPFTYRAYHPDGTPVETTTGPGAASWTDLDAISPFMIAAVLTTEDGAFYKHHGFNHHAIRSSVQANLKARRFVRGASTITMQLAKNLFLSRGKNLSRKVEEVVLTDYLEQVFQKDEMMELYLNVVEFGPDVYGITAAAEHYFGRKPEELDLAECFFLATLLPSPTRYGKLREKGQVPDTWMRHLHALMEIAAKNGKITRAELAEGLEQTVTFVREGDPRPEPRKPVSTRRREPYEDESAWQPLD